MTELEKRVCKLEILAGVNIYNPHPEGTEQHDMYQKIEQNRRLQLLELKGDNRE